MNQDSQDLDELERTTLAELEHGYAQVTANLTALVSGTGGTSAGGLAAAQAYTLRVEGYYAGFLLKAQQLAAGGHPRLTERLAGLVDEMRKIRLIYAQMDLDNRQTSAQIGALYRAQDQAESTAFGEETLAGSAAMHATMQKYIASINPKR